MTLKQTVFLLILTCLNLSCMQKNEITIGFPSKWGDLQIWDVNNLYSSGIIKNQYDTLVEIGTNGTIVPSLAESWIVDDNFSWIVFKLSKNIKFSDGSELTSFDVKKSWENTYKELKTSKNKKSSVVFENLSGVQEFNKNGSIPGIEIIDKNTLKITFNKSYRSGIFQFIDYQFSIYKLKENKILGTGPYVLQKDSGDSLKFTKNEYYKSEDIFNIVNVKVVEPSFAKKALISKDVDVLYYAPVHKLPFCKSKSKFKCIVSQDSKREVILLNGLPESRLNDVRIRQGLQAAFWKNITRNSLPKHLSDNFRLDGQVLLPFQLGRLDESEVKNIIKSGEKFIPLTQNQSKIKPYTLIISDEENWIPGIFLKEKIYIETLYGKLSSFEKVKIASSKNAPDLISSIYLVFLSDPDSLQHYLGKNGSVTFPLVFRPKVAALLDKGESITDLKKADTLYREVNKSILTETPFIHIGFRADGIVYNNKNIVFKGMSINRWDYKFEIFKPKGILWK